MALRGTNYFLGLAADLLRSNSRRNAMFNGIERMVRNDWKFQETFKQDVPDIFEVIDRSPYDAVQSGATALSGQMPYWQVIPHNINPLEYQRVDKLAEAIRWHKTRSNRRGAGTISFDKAYSSLVYNIVATQIHDLVMILPKDRSKWTPMQQEAWRHGRFLERVKNPKGILTETGSLGITTVVNIENLAINDVIQYWKLYEGNTSKEAKQALATIDQLESDVSGLIEKNKGDEQFPSRVRFIQVYCINYDQVITFGYITVAEPPPQTSQMDYNYNAFGIPDVLAISKPQYTFLETENPFGFLNWSIRQGGNRVENLEEFRVNPLLAPLWWTGSWQKLNMAKSLVFSEPLRRVREPRDVAVTRDGQGASIDYADGGTVDLRTGEDYKRLNPTTLDPQALQIIQAMETADARTTGASVLGDVGTISARTPYATYQAMIKVALARLDNNLSDLGQSNVDDAYIYLNFVKKTNVPLVAYRGGYSVGNLSGQKFQPGEPITIDAEQFDLDELDIMCDIKAKVPTDMMEQLNAAVILSKQLNVPMAYVLRNNVGLENIDLLYSQWVDEFKQNTELQAWAAEKMAAAQLKARNDVPMQPPPDQNGQNGQPMNGPGQGEQNIPPLGAGNGIANTSFGAAGSVEGNGFNPGAGGMSPTEINPGTTREMVSGMTQPQINFQRGGR